VLLSWTTTFPLPVAHVTQIESGGTPGRELQPESKYSTPIRSLEGWRWRGSATATVSPAGQAARLSPEVQRTLGPELPGSPKPSVQNGQSPRTGVAASVRKQRKVRVVLDDRRGGAGRCMMETSSA
jgi:hypothetical protein